MCRSPLGVKAVTAPSAGEHSQKTVCCAFNAKTAMVAVKGIAYAHQSFPPKPIQVAAAVVGNALEWYDFIVFGFLTVVIGFRS